MLITNCLSALNPPYSSLCFDTESEVTIHISALQIGYMLGSTNGALKETEGKEEGEG